MEKNFNHIIDFHSKILEKENKTFNIIGYVKLFFVIVIGISAYFMFTETENEIYLFAIIAELAVLIPIWIYHSKIKDKIDYSTGIIQINKRHLERLSGTWVDFKDTGEEYIDREHAYSSDLDIIGKKSLFQLLNTTNTWYGRKFFSNDLLQASHSVEEIKNRQHAISELSSNLEFTNEIEFYTQKTKANETLKDLVDELKDNTSFCNNKIFKNLIFYLPIFTLIFYISIVAFKLDSLIIVGSVCMLLQVLIWLLGLSKSRKYLQNISSSACKLSPYVNLIVLIKNRKFDSEKLSQIQSMLSASDESGENSIKELDRILAMLSVRNNLVVYFLLNTFLFWDFRCAIKLDEWKYKNSKSFEKIFIAIGEIESLSSFSILPLVCNNVTLPKVVISQKTITANQLGHPLLNNTTRINNDISLKDNIFIISGSNMSGKTTFLRTIGINLVLASCGSFVCAGEMSFTPMKILTSMRIADDLNEGISTFYAELKRIKLIIEASTKDNNSIFLIDEIFRGTNSVDRLSGAKSVITKLSEIGAIGLITTHDLELCEIVNHIFSIKNYSFSEYYENDKILFDYKIQEGISNTTNAKYLMKIIGII